MKGIEINMLYKNEIIEFIDHLQKYLFNETFKSNKDLEYIKEKLSNFFLQLNVKEYSVNDFILSLNTIKTKLMLDLQATYDNDPAANSLDEIIITYPGFYATMTYRIANELFIHNVPILPRLMTEVAHSQTGIDIHPGAIIGEYFFIDHGTGIVIGETTVIGNNVRIYQGVTLGALSLEHPSELRNKKRHPTILDNVIIYAGASILGGNTVIGNNVTIGSNVFITASIPDNTLVRFKETNYLIKKK